MGWNCGEGLRRSKGYRGRGRSLTEWVLVGEGKVGSNVGDGSRNIYQPGERIWYSLMREQDTGDDLVKMSCLVMVGESLK